MRNFKMTLSYDGSRYFGWERQPGKETIQGKLEAVLTRMCGTPVNVIGAGRTDAGVHARAMVANAYMDTDMEPEAIRDYLNHYLPDDIGVAEVKEAADPLPRALSRRGQAQHVHVLCRRDEAGVQPEVCDGAGRETGRGSHAARGGISGRRA